MTRLSSGSLDLVLLIHFMTLLILLDVIMYESLKLAQLGSFDHRRVKARFIKETDSNGIHMTEGESCPATCFICLASGISYQIV